MTKTLLEGLTAKEQKQVATIARRAGSDPDSMARALLQAHLVLIRDCGGILPPGASPAWPSGRAVSLAPAKFTGGAI